MCVFFHALRIHCLVLHQFSFFDLSYGVFIFISYIIFFTCFIFICGFFFGMFVCMHATLNFFYRDVRAWLNIVDKATNLVLLDNDNWMGFCCSLGLVVRSSIQHNVWCFILRFLPWLWWICNKIYLRICSGEGQGFFFSRGKLIHRSIWTWNWKGDTKGQG